MDDKVFYDIINCVDSAAMSLVWPAVQLIIGFFFFALVVYLLWHWLDER